MLLQKSQKLFLLLLPMLIMDLQVIQFLRKYLVSSGKSSVRVAADFASKAGDAPVEVSENSARVTVAYASKVGDVQVEASDNADTEVGTDIEEVSMAATASAMEISIAVPGGEYVTELEPDNALPDVKCSDGLASAKITFSAGNGKASPVIASDAPLTDKTDIIHFSETTDTLPLLNADSAPLATDTPKTTYNVSTMTSNVRSIGIPITDPTKGVLGYVSPIDTKDPVIETELLKDEIAVDNPEWSTLIQSRQEKKSGKDV